MSSSLLSREFKIELKCFFKQISKRNTLNLAIWIPYYNYLYSIRIVEVYELTIFSSHFWMLNTMVEIWYGYIIINQCLFLWTTCPRLLSNFQAPQIFTITFSKFFFDSQKNKAFYLYYTFWTIAKFNNVNIQYCKKQTIR